MKWCENCEEWIEPENGRCPICGKSVKEEKIKTDNYEEDELDPDELDWVN
jgi:rRNA maturation endonuclease Nob1